MTSQVVFLSLFLGLMAGPHLVELQVAPGVYTVRVLLENRPVAVLQQPPWRARRSISDRRSSRGNW